jgi:NitT/TauT family transport system permease protein
MTAVDQTVVTEVDSLRRGESPAGGGGRDRRRSRFARRGFVSLGKISLHVLVIGGVLGFWQYQASSGRVDPLLLPKPTKIVAKIWQPHNSGTVWYNLHPTLESLFIGFLLGSIAAFVLAVIFAEVPVLGAFFENYIHALGAIPFIVLAPLLLIWFSTAIQASIFVVALTTFTSLFANLYTGLSNTDARLLELGRILGVTRIQRLTKLRWWATLPYLFSGLKASLPRAIFSAVVIEFLGTSRGLGYLMVSDGNNLDTAGLFADVIVLIVIIRALLLFIRLIEDRVLAWRPKEQS